LRQSRYSTPASLPFDSPLPLPEKAVEDGSAVVLETTFASPLEPPVPGEPLEGSETRYRPFGEVRTEGVPVAGLAARCRRREGIPPHRPSIRRSRQSSEKQRTKREAASPDTGWRPFSLTSIQL